MSAGRPDPTVAGEGDELVCPRCGARYPGRARFCAGCRLPLVLLASGEPPPEPASDSPHGRARKIKPQLTEGELVSVVQARNQVEAEFIQGLLLEEGIPSILRRSAGFDVPDFLAAGPRDILVAQSALVTAREVLLQADLISSSTGAAAVAAAGRPASPLRLLVALLAILGVAILVVWLVTLISG